MGKRRRHEEVGASAYVFDQGLSLSTKGTSRAAYFWRGFIASKLVAGNHSRAYISIPQQRFGTRDASCIEIKFTHVSWFLGGVACGSNTCTYKRIEYSSHLLSSSRL